MIYYTLFGLLWVAFIEYLLTPKFDEESPFNNITRLINLVIWPIGFTILVISWIRNKFK